MSERLTLREASNAGLVDYDPTNQIPFGVMETRELTSIEDRLYNQWQENDNG